MIKQRARGLIGSLLAFLAVPTLAHANPVPWEISLQPAASPIMEMVERFNDGLLILITLITIFVLALLIYVIVRFNARANPVPSRTTHNTLIEVIWTVVPILILVGIAVPSFSLLFAEHDPARAIPGFNPDTDKQLTVKVTGNQWYWTYEYPDNGDFSFDSNMLQQNELKGDEPRLLAVDNEMIVPVGTVVRMLVIGNDVIHSFAVPSFGVKIDAVPGRLNQIWFLADHEGIYYGQCDQLCGQAPSTDPNDLHGHAFMPIAVRAVSQSVFDQWAKTAMTSVKTANQQLTALLAAPPAATPASAPAAPAPVQK